MIRSQFDEQLIESYRRIVEGYEDEIRTARYQRDEYKRQRDELVAAVEAFRKSNQAKTSWGKSLSFLSEYIEDLEKALKAAKGDA